MVKLEIGNSYSRILGLSAEHERAFRSYLSYTVNAKSHYFSGNYSPRRKSLVDKKNYWPTGLLERVYKFLKTNNLEHTAQFLAEKPILSTPGNLKPHISLYKAQGEALRAAYRVGRGIISMPTGTGKTRVIAAIAAYYNLKTLIVVPSLEIKKQLEQSLQDCMVVTDNVTIHNIDSNALKTVNEYDCLIIDEAHHVAAKTYQKLNKTVWNGIYHRFFLTATPFRNDTEETLLFESIAGQVIYKLSYQDAIREGYIVPVEAYYIEMPKKHHNDDNWHSVYNELVVNNKERNEAISLIMLRLNNAGLSTLCLVKEIDHGLNLAAISGLPFANGQDEESREYIQQFNSGEIKTLIATTGLMGEGVNSRACEYVIIAGLGKAKSAFMQQVGRAVRTYAGKESAKVVLIKDRSHKWCLTHFREQSKVLKEEYGVIIQKLEI